MGENELSDLDIDEKDEEEIQVINDNRAELAEHEEANEESEMEDEQEEDSETESGSSSTSPAAKFTKKDFQDQEMVVVRYEGANFPGRVEEIKDTGIVVNAMQKCKQLGWRWPR